MEMLTTEANVRCAQSDSDVENTAVLSASLDFFAGFCNSKCTVYE